MRKYIMLKIFLNTMLSIFRVFQKKTKKRSRALLKLLADAQQKMSFFALCNQIYFINRSIRIKHFFLPFSYLVVVQIRNYGSHQFSISEYRNNNKNYFGQKIEIAIATLNSKIPWKFWCRIFKKAKQMHT